MDPTGLTLEQKHFDGSIFARISVKYNRVLGYFFTINYKKQYVF
jgi:hypothetical protein